MSFYKADPNNSKKQIVSVQGRNIHDRASNPQTCSLHKAPNYVLINTVLTTPIGFFFGSSASFAAIRAAQGYDVGGSGPGSNATHLSSSDHYDKMGDDLPAGTKLYIHPTAWSGSAADAGKVTFVYKSGRSTGGL